MTITPYDQRQNLTTMKPHAETDIDRDIHTVIPLLLKFIALLSCVFLIFEKDLRNCDLNETIFVRKEIEESLAERSTQAIRSDNEVYLSCAEKIYLHIKSYKDHKQLNM